MNELGLFIPEVLYLFSKVNNMKRIEYHNTKTLATLGPASSSKEMMTRLVQAGVDVFRINFSHGKHEDAKVQIDRIYEVSQETGQHIGILADLQGPKLRVGEMENNGVDLEPGDEIIFINEPCLGTKRRVYMSYDQFAEDVNVGERVLLDDGKLIFEVLETNGEDEVKLKVLYGGVLSSNKGVNLPDTDISLPCLTEKDLADLDFILTQKVHWIALSFVRSAVDIEALQKRLNENNYSAKIIAKIEKPDAVSNIDEIIEVADGIMIARGDLGVEVPMEKLPAIQKNIIKKCIQRGKPVVVATQMMESMIENPSPTRAEVTDVANAVLDGADAVMLSGETSVGKHPDLVVKAMNKIINEAENNYELEAMRPKPDISSPTYYSDTVCITAAQMAEYIDARAILGMTVSGYTAFKVSSYRPNCDIFIFSPNQHILATLNLVWGVRCFYYGRFTTTDETHEDVIKILKENHRIIPGDVVVNTGSMPIQDRGRTNMMKITQVR
jgi:pyruvate kinase